MSYEFFIALRYLRTKRKQAFISVITIIAVIGVMVGVAVMILVLSGMSGFEEDLKSKILGAYAHIVLLQHGGGIENYEKVAQRVREVEGVVGVTPFIYNEVMLTSGNRVAGVVLRGIDPDTIGEATQLPENLREGSLAALRAPPTPPGTPRLPGIIVGVEIARTLSLELGDEVTVVSPIGTVTPAGNAPSYKKFRVVGTFASGMFEFDAKFAFIELSEAQRFFETGDTVTGLVIKVDDVLASDTISRAIQQKLGFPYWTRDWKEMNRNLFSAIQLEKIFMRLILSLIILVAAVNIISTLVMMVLEKGRDIAILKSMGATDRSIMKIFVWCGLVIGSTGTLLGAIVGYGVCWLNITYRLIPLDPKIYYIDHLPMKVEMGDTLFVLVTAVAISFLATLYPSWKASQIRPVEGLRYE